MDNRGFKDGRGEMIAQEDLEQYELCQEEARVARRNLEAVRDRLMDQLRRGIPLEQGRLGVEIRTSTVRSFSFGKLVAVLGRTRVERLQDQIEPTITRRLYVAPTPAQLNPMWLPPTRKTMPRESPPHRPPPRPC
jgi:hypothetical protein